MTMDETISIQEVPIPVTENISTINDELNLIVILIGLLITSVFYIVFCKTKIKTAA